MSAKVAISPYSLALPVPFRQALEGASLETHHFERLPFVTPIVVSRTWARGEDHDVARRRGRLLASERPLVAPT